MKEFFGKFFACLFLLAFVALSIYLAFFMDGTWVSEDGGAINQIIPKVLILVFFGAMPLFLLLWILFPKPFNKLLYKGVNKFMRSGAKMMKYKEQREEQNVPDITINGMNIPTVMAAADMLADRINGEEPCEELKELPYICEECGFVLESTAKFCTNCGAARKL
ncbi:MAG: zinc ribbon domain-containing protein [Oscillospiraceae bacterium]|nr:zinc ribbon domain-containing protein [Oscillospiraceae bacterium]